MIGSNSSLVCLTLDSQRCLSVAVTALCSCSFFILFLFFPTHPRLAPPPHLFTSYRSECGAQFGSGSTGHLVLCVCICVRMRVFVLVFLDVDSRLRWTSNKQSCNVRVDVDGIYNAAPCFLKLYWSFFRNIDWLNIASNIRQCRCAARRRDVTLYCIVRLSLCLQCEFQCFVFCFSKIKQPVEREANHNTIISLCQENN